VGARARLQRAEPTEPTESTESTELDEVDDVGELEASRRFGRGFDRMRDFRRGTVGQRAKA